MEESENLLKKPTLIENNQLDIPKFYKELEKAISTNNMQSIWELSKMITRFHCK